MKLYDYLDSGNGYKVRLLMAQLGLACERIELDIFADDPPQRRADFLAKNPNGRVPTLELDDGQILAESNAILFYLAEGTRFLPDDRLARAQSLQWMFFEQYSHEPYVAVARSLLRHYPADHPRRAALTEKQEGGRKALGVMERHLTANDFFVGGRYGIADIALYAYSHVAEQAEIDLAPYPAVRAWLARVARQPGHVPMTAD